MSNFETDNQDKSNLVGDNLEVYKTIKDQPKSILINRIENLDILLNSRGSKIVALEQEVSDLKSELMSDAVDVEQELIRNIDELRAKAKAWDDLEALTESQELMIVKHETGTFSIDNMNPFFNNLADQCLTLKEAVSNALESIRGES